jgi:glycosyltransferase involved in cell wall biosynthesis
MINKTQISYVIPTLNSAATLDMTLLSLQLQRNVGIKTLVVDSGSTDGTLDICKRWDVKTIYAEPGNMYQAINLGLKQCDTEWLGYINSDDWLYMDSVARLVAQGIEDQADIVYGNCDYTDEDSRFVYSLFPARPNHLLSLFRCGVMGFAQQSVIFHKRIYQKLDGFNEDFRFSSDADFYVRAIQSGAKFSYLPNKSVSCFRIHENQLSNKNKELMEAEQKKIYGNLGKRKIIDRFIFFKWRYENIPYYVLRLLRQSSLSGHIKLTNSMSIYK